MEIKIILTVIIGALTQIESVQIFDDSGCTYTGANCPITPCCNSKFECKLTTLSLFSLPPDLYELSARNKTYRCLDKIPLGGSCLFHEECSHITNSRCISSLCKCMSSYYNYQGRCYAWYQYDGRRVVITRP
ncbi:hypothetical protein G9C98_004788 [Cotesia typhae]|uniref:EB domain-containing protein n=1 Tax=Cotesia typhae TaxID=2053667 RepID=A0A8J5QLQ5_9HYME|nr:hypothetical protein G9C98_004788 [Cotesia typhae]